AERLSIRPGSTANNATSRAPRMTGTSHAGPGRKCWGIKNGSATATASISTIGVRRSPLGWPGGRLGRIYSEPGHAVSDRASCEDQEKDHSAVLVQPGLEDRFLCVVARRWPSAHFMPQSATGGLMSER